MKPQHTVKPEPDAAALRQFGLAFGAIIAVLFGLLLPLLFARDLPWWPWLTGAVFVLWALAAPSSLAPVYRVWMLFGNVMQRITTPVLLALIFFVVITPVGLCRRWFARDPMNRRFDPDSDSYRQPSKASKADDLKRPF